MRDSVCFQQFLIRLSLFNTLTHRKSSLVLKVVGPLHQSSMFIKNAQSSTFKALSRLPNKGATEQPKKPPVNPKHLLQRFPPNRLLTGGSRGAAVTTRGASSGRTWTGVRQRSSSTRMAPWAEFGGGELLRDWVGGFGVRQRKTKGRSGTNTAFVVIVSLCEVFFTAHWG